MVEKDALQSHRRRRPRVGDAATHFYYQKIHYNATRRWAKKNSVLNNVIYSYVIHPISGEVNKTL